MTTLRRPISGLTLFVLFFCGISCTDLEFDSQSQSGLQKPQIDPRSKLSKPVLDSTLRAEEAISASMTNGNESQTLEVLASGTSANYALQATVSAESTYPGYSVNRIKDGSRNTTVGPSYSWANNFPAGGKLPESVFLKFSSLRSVDRIDIYTSSGYALRNYTIQFRTTPTASWITLLVITGNTSVMRSHTFTAVNLLEVQIICQLGPNNQNIYGRLNEVEIYGPLEPTLPSITVANGILSFNSFADVEQTLDYLEYRYEQYDDAFLTQYPGLTDDQYETLEESLNYDDDQPYINFENQYGISSKRAQIVAAEDAWLDTAYGDSISMDPDDIFIPDDELRTIVNSFGELRIGTTYYVFNDDGSYYEGGVQYLNEVIALRTLKKGQALPPHITRHESQLSAVIEQCRSGKRDTGYKYNSGHTWRFKHVTSIWNFPWGGRIIGKTKSYKKKSNGKWRKRRATIGVLVRGDVTRLGCDGLEYLESAYKERKRRKVKMRVGGQVFIKTYPFWVESYHYGGKVGNHWESLNW